MAIYNKIGSILATAYSADGTEISKAYDVFGSEAFSSVPIPNYNSYEFSTLGGTVGQGIAIYGNILARWDGSTKLNLYTLSPFKSKAVVDTGESSHGNDASFSDEFYSAADDLPLIYIDSNLCFRIYKDGSTWTSTLIRKITTPNVYGMKIAAGFDGNTLITIGYSENQYTYSATNKLIIAKWDMTELTENGNGTYTPALISTVTRDWLECIQGASYHDGYLWVASGLGNTGNKGYVYALDVETGDIIYSIDTGSTNELEGLAWGYNETDNWYIVIGQTGFGFRKITFEYN